MGDWIRLLANIAFRLIWIEWLHDGADEEESAVPLTPATPKTNTSTEIDPHNELKRSMTASSEPETVTDKIQSERNTVFSAASDWLPWIFSLEFMQGLFHNAADAHNGANDNVILMRKKAQSVRHPKGDRAGPSGESTEYRPHGGGYERV